MPNFIIRQSVHGLISVKNLDIFQIMKQYFNTELVTVLCWQRARLINCLPRKNAEKEKVKFPLFQNFKNPIYSEILQLVEIHKVNCANSNTFPCYR